MAPRKRPYRPKVKGCHECSKRRVSCDRRVPQCAKCCARGLKCSGTDVDIRIRFADGVNTRGKWAGETIESLCEKRQKSKKAEAINHQQRWSDFTSNSSNAVSLVEQSHAERPESRDCNDTGSLHVDASGMNPARHPQLIGEFAAPLTETDSDSSWFLQDCHQISTSLSSQHDPPSSFLECSLNSPAKWPLTGFLGDKIPSWKRKLLLHCKHHECGLTCQVPGTGLIITSCKDSEHIASEMVAIDGSHNGWRHIILPMAHSDELVMNAVLAVSAFHRDEMQKDCAEYSRTHANQSQYAVQRHHFYVEPIYSPQALYDLVIDGLRQRSNLSECSYGVSQSTPIAVLLLLVAAMVTRIEDFSTILSMLHSATDALGGEHQLESSELGSFLVRQLRKNRVYAAPHISEFAGVETLASQSRWNQYFDCVRYCSQGGRQNASVVAVIANVMQQAHDIYLQGVAGQKPWSIDNNCEGTVNGGLDERIERFKETLQQLPEREPGAHVLVWAIFIVATASSLGSHRAFFQEALLRHYSRSRFANLLRGIRKLPYIWAKADQGARWTELLPEARLFTM